MPACSFLPVLSTYLFKPSHAIHLPPLYTHSLISFFSKGIEYYIGKPSIIIVSFIKEMQLKC